MKRYVKAAITHPLISGSLVVLAGSMGGNFFNFFYNLFMSRNLKLEDYGTLISLSSLVILISIPVGAVIPTVVNYAGTHFANNDFDSVRAFFYKLIKPIVLISLVILFLSIFFSSQLGSFFQIESRALIVLAGITVFFAYLGTVNSGLLQAKLAFKYLSVVQFLSLFLKFSAGAILVLLGFGVNGAMTAFLLSFIMPFVLGFIPLKFLIQKAVSNKKITNIKEISSYGISSAVVVFSLNSLVSTDILLVKHLFNPLDAGIYAGISLVGKVIFFLTAPISTVMFPLIVQKNAKKESYGGILRIAIFLVALSSLVVSVIYFLYPEEIIKLFLKRDDYLQAAPFLGFFGIFIAIYSVVSLLVYYFLSLKKTKISIIMLSGAILQAVFIYFYHNTFLDIILISTAVSIVLLLLLLLYYWQIRSKRKLW